MQKLLDGLQAALAQETDAHGQPKWALIPQRSPASASSTTPTASTQGRRGHLYLKWIDEHGQEQTRWYDGKGNRNDGSGETLGQDFSKLVNAALVPTWEAQTVLEHWQFLTHEAGECAAQAQDIQQRLIGERQARLDALVPQSNAAGEYDAFLADPQRQAQAAELQREIAWWQEHVDRLEKSAGSLRHTADRPRAGPQPRARWPAAGARRADAELRGARPAGGRPMAPDSGPREAWIDIDADGYLERTEWTGANQGVLAVDANLDGLSACTSSSPPAAGGLRWGGSTPTATAGSMPNDPAFGALKLWLDVNGNGLTLAAQAGTQPGEPTSLISELELLGMSEVTSSRSSSTAKRRRWFTPTAAARC